jgi:methoxymalonate biosynthesis acyl carrier protein
LTNPTQRIREYLSSVIPLAIEDDEDIFELGLVDSLFAIQLVAFVEKEFSITAEPTDLDISNFCSIAALTCFVERKVGEGAPDEFHASHDK